MARVTLIWTPGAVRDLEQIHAYIAVDSPRYADLVAARLVQAFERVVAFPESGRVVPELARHDVRELIQGAYRLVYWLARAVIAGVICVVRSVLRMPSHPLPVCDASLRFV